MERGRNTVQRIDDVRLKSGNTHIRLDAQASDLGEQVYDDLSEGKPGLFGAVTGRAEPQVLRLEEAG
jgi:hypothetical protein